MIRLKGSWVTGLLLLAIFFYPARSAAPDPPSNPSPADDSTGVPAAAVLCTDVRDPQGEDLDATFLARDTGRAPADPFTIIFLPDTQYYSQTYPEIYMSQLRWVVENRKALNIRFVSHLGDIVQIAGITQEWDNAWAAMSLLEDPATTELPEGIPYGLSVGNHDQHPNNSAGTVEDPGQTTANFNQYFGLSRFAGKSYFGGHAFDNNDNNYQLFEAGGMKFIIFHHEFDNTFQALVTPVLQWTDALLDTYSDRRAIVTSHSLLCTVTACPDYLEAEFSAQGLATYEALKHHTNLFLMHCGHAGVAQMQPRRADTYNDHTIHTLLADYQRLADCPLACGRGYLRIMTFYPAQDRISVQTYSPWLDEYLTDPCTDGSDCQQFELDYDMNGGVQFETIGTVTGVPSGMAACLPWSGRQPGSEYEWQARVANSTDSTTSATWSFVSDGLCGPQQDCDDQELCTSDSCDSGTCSNTPIADCCEIDADCDDDNYCTDDVCSANVCSHVDNTNACNDDDPCTVSDTCSAGQCSGTQLDCDDGNACTSDSCIDGECLGTFAPAPGCCVVDADCADGVRCTVDSCLGGGVCAHPADPDCCQLDTECGNDGTVCSTAVCPSWNESALLLDGVRDFVTVGPAPGLGLTEFTLECWFNWDGGGSAAQTSGWPYDPTDIDGAVAYPLVTKGQIGRDDFTHLSVNYFLGLAEANHVLQADFEEHASGSAGKGLNHSVSGSTPILAGDWHHAAATYNGTCWQLYLDGQPETNGSNCPAEPPAYESQSHFAIGTFQTHAGAAYGRYSGLIDEVRVWSRALDGDEIRANLSRQIESAPDLVARWDFNSRTGFVTPDSTGAGNDGVMVHGALVRNDVVYLGGHCALAPTGACGVSGTTLYYRDNATATEPSSKPVPGVALDADLDGWANATTDGAGSYSIGDLAGGVTVAPLNKFGAARAADHNDAITSLDAAYIAQHAVELITLSPAQLIAADVTGNGQVTAFDAANVAQFASESIDHFDVALARGSDWRFLRCDHYVNASDQDCAEPSHSYDPLSQPEAAGFYAILYGDVTGNWAPAGSRSADDAETAVAAADRVRASLPRPVTAIHDRTRAGDAPVTLSLRGRAARLQAGRQRELVIATDDASGIESFDLVLQYDPSEVRVVQVSKTGLGSTLALASNDRKGVLKIGLFGPLPLQGGGDLLTVRFEALTNSRRGARLVLDGQADEGRTPLRVGGQRRNGFKLPIPGVPDRTAAGTDPRAGRGNR